MDPVATGQGDARAGVRSVLASKMIWWFLVLLLFCGYLVVALWFPLLSDSEQIDLADIYTFYFLQSWRESIRKTRRRRDDVRYSARGV